MRKFTVTSEQASKHVVKVASEVFPGAGTSDLYRALKHKDIKINGKRISQDIAVQEGQEVEVWLPDEILDRRSSSKQIPQGSKKADYKIVMQTDNLLLVNKRQGLAVHSGKNTGETNLIDLIRRDTHNNEAELCHRIDMNTGGLVLIAKNKKALEDAIKLFKEDLLIKRYRCMVIGCPTEGEPVVCEDDTVMKEISAYLEKVNRGSVYIHDTMQKGDLDITTRYRVLKSYGEISELECELVTGRTHQIRAQMAHLGCPIVGDGNYGRNKINMQIPSVSGGKIKYQQLFATTLMFRKIPKDNMHSELSGRKFVIEPAFDVDIKAFKDM